MSHLLLENATREYFMPLMPKLVYLMFSTFDDKCVPKLFSWNVSFEIILKMFRLQVTAESKIFKRQIADNFFLTTSQHKDVEYVHIRRYEKTEDGQNRFLQRRGPLFHPNDGLLSTI